jgi:hypothetical protein
MEKGAERGVKSDGVLVVASADVTTLACDALHENANFHPISVIPEGTQALGYLTASGGFSIVRRPRFIVWECGPGRPQESVEWLRKNPGTKGIPIILVLPDVNGRSQSDGLLYLKKTTDVAEFRQSIFELSRSLIKNLGR